MFTDHLLHIVNVINDDPNSFNDIVGDINETLCNMGFPKNYLSNQLKREKNSTLKKYNDLANHVSSIYN